MRPTWTLDQQALAVSNSVYLDRLTPFDLEPLAACLLGPPGSPLVLPGRQAREAYADALHDLHRLLEEVRYEVALAAMLVTDFRQRRDRGEIETHPALPVSLPLSVELVAALAPRMPSPPPPSLLTQDLHRQMRGGRYVSTWLAGQLLDSALGRSLSCLDRVATLVHLRTGRPIKTSRDGKLRMPAFRWSDLQPLAAYYLVDPAWAELVAVLGLRQYRQLKETRDGFTHQRRRPSELHGETKIFYWNAGSPDDPDDRAERSQEGLSAQAHLDLLVTSWNDVLRPVVAAAGELVVAPVADRR